MGVTTNLAAALSGLLLAADVGPGDAAASAVLLIGNKGDDTVSFVDLATGAELGRHGTGPQPHEIAVSPDGRHAAVVAYAGSTIDLFDVCTRRRSGVIDLGPNGAPHGIAWLADGRILAATARSRAVTVIDPRTNGVAPIPTDQDATHMLAVSADLRFAYASNIASGTVTVIDLENGRKVRDIQVGGRPEGIALANGDRELWVGDNVGDRVVAFDTTTFEQFAEVPTGGMPIRVIAGPDGRIVTSNARDGTLTVIDAARRAVEQTVPVSGAAEAVQITLLFSSRGDRLYVAETGLNKVAELSWPDGAVLRRLDAGLFGDGLAVAVPAGCDVG